MFGQFHEGLVANPDQFCLEYCLVLPEAETKFPPRAIAEHTSSSALIYLGTIYIPDQTARAKKTINY
jgi:hypothetical protein